MKTRILLIVACAFTACIGRAETVENIEKTFPVKPGGSLVVDVDFGSIDVSTHEAAEARVEVRRTIERTDKAAEDDFLKDRPVTFDQDGAISASLSSLTDDVTRSTSGGGVTLRAPENSAFNLDASASGGGVRSDWPVAVEGKRSRHRVKGTVNGGGKSVVLHTGGGGIHVGKL